MAISLADLLYPNVGGIANGLMATTPEEKKTTNFFETTKDKKKTGMDLTTTVDIDGKNHEIPLLVPTLTKKESDILKGINPESKTLATDIPKSILDKATEHAKKRLDDKKSQFFAPGDPRASTLLTEATSA
jgi:cAMP phosphodiesterase